ncbi:MAG: carbohydrate ABC transporter permease, partial [Clostridia bacterium]|nr:carbohydrate ABC transporter permease [Clostridia bacterium]
MTLLRRLKPKRRLSRSVGGTLLLLVFILAIGFVMALPLVYTVVTAFKPINELFLYPPRFFVQNPTGDNFIQMMSIVNNSWVPFSRYLFNSVFVSLVGTTAYIFIASMAAYPLAKHAFPGHKAFSSLLVWAILFRSEVTAIAVYIILAWLGMINTYWSLLLPTLAGSFGVFLMQQFMVSFPNSVLEAARIDGAGEWRIFGSIVMPSVKPGWITLIIFTFQSFWNATATNYIYDEELRMLP